MIISTGKDSALRPTVTIGSGTASFQFGTISAEASRKYAAIWLSTLALVGDSFGKDNVESRDAVGGDHYHDVVVDGVDVAHFAVVDGSLTGKFKVCLDQCSSHCL